MPKNTPWDYLIITAANEQQARSYELQLRQRENSDGLQRVREWLVVPDIDGRRIGSGGSTLHCLAQALERECAGDGVRSFDEAEAVLGELRILIVHAGGDSRRLPPYSHCGKMFVPLPESIPSQTPVTLFDRLIPTFLDLQAGSSGQMVIASGDALILFDPSTVDLSRPGVNALGLWAAAKESANHGVFCADDNRVATRYLQKPSLEQQQRSRALNEAGQSVLDLGVMSFDAAAAAQMLRTFFAEPGRSARDAGLVWKQNAREVMSSHGIDLYREICCALGTDTKFVDYVQNLRAGGSRLESVVTAEWFRSLHEIPLHVCILPDAKFLHFGTTHQLITSGIALLKEESSKSVRTALILNSEIHSDVKGQQVWVEGCSVDAKLVLEGLNVVVGAEIAEPLTLAKRTCLDVSMGENRAGDDVWFFRCYDIDDSFKHSAEAGGTFCGMQIGQWLHEMGGEWSDIWSHDVAQHERTLWNASVFPALKEKSEFRKWLWLFHPASATAKQKSGFWRADRYSSAEIAIRMDQEQFHAHRVAIRTGGIPHDNGAMIPATSLRT